MRRNRTDSAASSVEKVGITESCIFPKEEIVVLKISSLSQGYHQMGFLAPNFAFFASEYFDENFLTPQNLGGAVPPPAAGHDDTVQIYFSNVVEMLTISLS